MFKPVAFVVLLSAAFMLAECDCMNPITVLNLDLNIKLEGFKMSSEIKRAERILQIVSNELDELVEPKTKELAELISKLAPLQKSEEYCTGRNVENLRVIMYSVVSHNNELFEQVSLNTPISFMLKVYADKLVEKCIPRYESNFDKHFLRKKALLKEYKILEKLDAVCHSKDANKNSLGHLNCVWGLSKESDKSERPYFKLREVLHAISTNGQAGEEKRDLNSREYLQIVSENWNNLLERCQSFTSDDAAMEILEVNTNLCLAYLKMKPKSTSWEKTIFGWASRATTCKWLEDINLEGFDPTLRNS